mgnify:FL=1
MKKPTFLTVAIMFVLFCFLSSEFCLPAYAGVPHLINYQGRITDSGGTPLNGSYALTFRIYDAETAGNLLWEEVQNGVVIQKGIFTVLLGSVTNLNLAFDKPYFLEIKVGGEVMSPRQWITSAGYAIRAEKAEISAALTGVLPVSNGGTGVTAMANAANGVVVLNASSQLPAVSGALLTNLPSYTPSTKIGSFTRAGDIVSGDQVITGVGFQPKYVIFLAFYSPYNQPVYSDGFDNVTSHYCRYRTDSGIAINSGVSIKLMQPGNNAAYQTGYISAVSSDGFTITWTEVQSGAGTLDMTIIYLAYK